MITITIAIIFSRMAFRHYTFPIAICCSLIFAATAIFSNYILRPRAYKLNFVNSDYKLTNQFNLEILDNGEYTKKIINKQGYELVLFKSFGNDGKEMVRRLPRDLVRLIYSNENVIKLYSAKKTIKGNPLISVFRTTYADLKAEILSNSNQCCYSSDSRLCE